MGEGGEFEQSQVKKPSLSGEIEVRTHLLPRMQNQSSASDSSLSSGREASRTDGELNRDSRAMEGDTSDASNICANDSDTNNFVDDLQHEMSNNDDVYDAVGASSTFIVKRLKELYQNHVLDAEKRYHLHFNFCLPTDGEIKESEFDAAPMVLLIGQYSTGKVCVFFVCYHQEVSFVSTIDCRCYAVSRLLF